MSILIETALVFRGNITANEILRVFKRLHELNAPVLDLQVTLPSLSKELYLQRETGPDALDKSSLVRRAFRLYPHKRLHVETSIRHHKFLL